MQGALADVFLRGTELVTDVRGMAALVCTTTSTSMVGNLNIAYP